MQVSDFFFQIRADLIAGPSAETACASLVTGSAMAKTTAATEVTKVRHLIQMHLIGSVEHVLTDMVD